MFQSTDVVQSWKFCPVVGPLCLLCQPALDSGLWIQQYTGVAKSITRLLTEGCFLKLHHLVEGEDSVVAQRYASQDVESIHTSLLGKQHVSIKILRAILSHHVSPSSFLLPLSNDHVKTVTSPVEFLASTRDICFKSIVLVAETLAQDILFLLLLEGTVGFPASE